MILEALNFAATYPLTPRRRRHEISSSVSLWARSRRAARHWRTHEEACHQEVSAIVATLPNTRAVAVLGSGLLRDVPISLLSKEFDRVYLFDLQHLASVRIWARLNRLANLEFQTRDLSGVEQLKAKPEAEPRPLAFLTEIPKLDLVVSANLLSQIGVGIGRMAATDAKLPPQAPERLIAAHVDGLQRLSCPSLLLTDQSYEVIDKTGKVLERDDLMKGVRLPPARAEWSWTVAPYGELSPDYQAVHRVASIPINAS
ncbi:hypothetical protein M2360_000093 [Rhizobium sp. SG_E_25_P2]|uniref:hypothetical protein n=1 Tax=Rhizobium sp. SG_E_25_P2 TaxID=2879942 RepID=UPI00247522B4|nr:hypothetical protein [Rhizobium sp. SG_E_25_P2]MDH6264712.1 hypothetical protein [Rhizobium sp. SG_E_25_P2]